MGWTSTAIFDDAHSMKKILHHLNLFIVSDLSQEKFYVMFLVLYNFEHLFGFNLSSYFNCEAQITLKIPQYEVESPSKTYPSLKRNMLGCVAHLRIFVVV